MWTVCFVVGAASRLFAARAAFPAWAPGVALVGLGTLRGHASTYLVAGPAIALLTAVLLVAWRFWSDVTAPTLRPIIWLGTVSYAAYLWNYPLTIWLRPHAEHAGILAALLTVPLAALSWYAVERPWMAPMRTCKQVAP